MATIVKRFWSEQRGASAIEFALIVPLLLMVLIGTVTMFDLFRNAQNVEKATFTVGDILSRQTTVNDSLLNSLLTLVQQTVPSADDGALRISSIAMVGTTLELKWSKNVGAEASIGARDIPYDLVPDIADGDSVLLTESFVPHTAVVAAFGLDRVVFDAHSVHRPRFVSSIVFAN